MGKGAANQHRGGGGGGSSSRQQQQQAPAAGTSNLGNGGKEANNSRRPAGRQTTRHCLLEKPEAVGVIYSSFGYTRHHGTGHDGIMPGATPGRAAATEKNVTVVHPGPASGVRAKTKQLPRRAPFLFLAFASHASA